jgi:hypothetical protein
VIPVARKVWQPTGATMSAAVAPTPDHSPCVGPAHRVVGGQAAVVPACGAERPALAVVGDGCCVDLGAQGLRESVVARYSVLLATFLMEPGHPAGTPRLKDIRPVTAALR